MKNHIILGRGRSIHKQDIPHALYYHQLAHQQLGSGTVAQKKNYGGRMLTSPSNQFSSLAIRTENKQFKPLKFKM